jgi:hypothetical protein
MATEEQTGARERYGVKSMSSETVSLYDEARRDADAKDVRRSPSAWVEYYGWCAMECQSPLPDLSVKAERDKLRSRTLCNPCGRYGAKNMYRWIGVETGLNNKLQRHSEWCIECGILGSMRIPSSLCRTTDTGCEFGYSAANERRKTMWKMRRVVSLSDRRAMLVRLLQNRRGTVDDNGTAVC